jgi:hypothetical protein
MKLQTSKNPIYGAAIALSCAAVATTAQINANLASDRAELTRQNALMVTAKHVIADTCWQILLKKPLLIGDSINIGSLSSKTPTACFKGNGEYGFAAYTNGQLKITQVFSIKEIQAAKSILEPKKR